MDELLFNYFWIDVIFFLIDLNKFMFCFNFYQ